MIYTDLTQQEQDNILSAVQSYIVMCKDVDIMKPNISYKIYWVGSWIDGDAKEYSDYDILIVILSEDSVDIKSMPDYFSMIRHFTKKLYQEYALLHTIDIRFRTVEKFLTDRPYLLLEEYNGTKI